MSNYDKSVHSKNKLGIVGHVPVSPFAAIAAQIKISDGSLHLRVMGDSYITGHMRGAIPPSRIKATMLAIQACPQEPSYSGSDSQYHRLEVAGDGATGVQTLMAGETEVCKVVIDPAWTIISSDEPLADQIDGDDGDDGDGDGDSPDDED